ncbi:response regulator [Treponema rectale]|uniref:Response regulator n=1 Tax=Treponema rectale TaxID=744512 RepID=A0A840SC96_9SPIR|nr:response regulator [Treponema rectale]MBB5219397.1 two-component system response regulator YesN [Treponema rectale]QOS40723.1 response regulator [Treponema rectale]
MITIVVADDEKLIRAGIKKILMDNVSADLNVIEAKNGKEALDYIKENSTDVLITDIKMPVMDGVELMQNVRELPRKPAMIVLSGFDDFNYAKVAISSGVLAYILKPVDSKELCTAVNSALNSVKKIEKSQTELKLKSLIIEGGSRGIDDLKDINMFHGFCCVTVKIPSGMNDENFYSVLDPNLCYVLEKKKHLAGLVIQKDYLEEIISLVKKNGCTAGISTCSDNVVDLRKLYHQSCSSVLRFFFEDEQFGSVFTYDAESSVSDFSEIDLRYEKFIAALDLLSENEIKKAMSNLLEFDYADSGKKAESVLYVHDKLVSNLFKRYPKFHDNDTYLYLKSLMIENIVQVDSYDEWKHYIGDYVIYLTQLLIKQQGKYPYITKAISYVNRHYSENITMATVANYVSMNYTWFSEKFKEQVGTNFNDYLKKFRMEQAKRLLEMGTYKVYEVANKSGFRDVKHFMKTFRELNGMSAGEWAKIHSRYSED